MSEFMTQDGVKVATLPTGAVLVDGETHVNAKAVRALRQYFGQEPPDLIAARARWQHQEDARLGRWRWPENPDYVVYGSGPDSGVVLDEGSGESRSFWRRSVNEVASTGVHARLQPAARAYFDAHPEPKPWHDAKVGDVWLLSFRGWEDDPSPWTVCQVNARDMEFLYPQNGNCHPLTDPEIVDAHRIWPEATS